MAEEISRPPEDDPRLAEIHKVCKQHEGRKGDLLIVLQQIQGIIGYFPKWAVEEVSGTLGVSPSDIFGVLTFYNRFHLSPRGKHTIRCCRGTACHFKGAGEIIEMIRRRYNLEDGKNTTDDGEFSIEEVACLGACGIAPVMTVDEDTYGNLTPLDALSAIRKYGPPDQPDQVPEKMPDRKMEPKPGGEKP